MLKFEETQFLKALMLESGDNLSSLRKLSYQKKCIHLCKLKQKDGFLGEKYNYFSLFDEETYQSITLDSKPEIYFQRKM